MKTYCQQKLETMAMVEKTISRMYWRQRDNGDDSGSVSLPEVVAELKRLGYSVRCEPSVITPSTYYVDRIPRAGGSDYLATVETYYLYINGIPVAVEEADSWHGGYHSGHRVYDVCVIDLDSVE